MVERYFRLGFVVLIYTRNSIGIKKTFSYKFDFYAELKLLLQETM
jgi:hypothetical protein